MNMDSNESQVLLYECNKEFHWFSTGSASNMTLSIDNPEAEHVALPSINLNSIFSIDRSSVFPDFSPKNEISTKIDENVTKNLNPRKISNKI